MAAEECRPVSRVLPLLFPRRGRLACIAPRLSRKVSCGRREPPLLSFSAPSACTRSEEGLSRSQHPFVRIRPSALVPTSVFVLSRSLCASFRTEASRRSTAHDLPFSSRTRSGPLLTKGGFRPQGEKGFSSRRLHNPTLLPLYSLSRTSARLTPLETSRSSLSSFPLRTLDVFLHLLCPFLRPSGIFLLTPRIPSAGPHGSRSSLVDDDECEGPQDAAAGPHRPGCRRFHLCSFFAGVLELGSAEDGVEDADGEEGEGGGGRGLSGGLVSSLRVRVGWSGLTLTFLPGCLHRRKDLSRTGLLKGVSHSVATRPRSASEPLPRLRLNLADLFSAVLSITTPSTPTSAPTARWTVATFVPHKPSSPSLISLLRSLANSLPRFRNLAALQDSNIDGIDLSYRLEGNVDFPSTVAERFAVSVPFLSSLSHPLNPWFRSVDAALRSSSVVLDLTPTSSGRLRRLRTRLGSGIRVACSGRNIGPRRTTCALFELGKTVIQTLGVMECDLAGRG
mgnify:FL=1